MIDTTTARTGTTVTLVYSPEDGGAVVRQTFKGMTPDDIVAVSAALAGRRMQLPVHDDDMEQLKVARHRQMRWYADRMTEALYDGLGRWFRWLPERVRINTLQLLMDYLRDITATWTSELIAVHAEANRTDTRLRVQRLRPRSAPESGPRILCVCCDNSTLLAPLLPEGWTSDADGVHCPKHPAGVVKESTG